MNFDPREQRPQLFIELPIELNHNIAERAAIHADLLQENEPQEDDNADVYDRDIPFYATDEQCD
jgi:hypothetical protein